MTVRALIVGIDRYEIPGWNLNGPCANAIAIARWLRSQGVEPGDMKIFLAPDDNSRASVEAFEEDGFYVDRTGEFHKITRYWRTELRQGVGAGTYLFVFWSGHGVVGKNGQRVWFCSDYTKDQPDNIFHADRFLAHLRSQPFAMFANQVVIADVCGNYAHVPLGAAGGDPADQQARHQLAYYATRPGRPTLMQDGIGVFTTRLLSALKAESLPIDQDRFIRCMDGYLKSTDEQPYCVRHYSDGGEVNIPFRESFKVLAGSAYNILSSFVVDLAWYRQQFTATLRHLAATPQERDWSLKEMIDHLAGYHSESDDLASDALTEFLMRVDAHLDSPIVREWIEKYSHGYTRQGVLSQLMRESSERQLLIEVRENGERLDGFTAFLCYGDFSLVEDHLPRTVQTGDWAQFQISVADLINDLRRRLRQSSIRIHFIVNPPLFGYPFHKIDLGNDFTLGEEMVCVVHHRDRAYGWDGLAHVLRDTHEALAQSGKPLLVLPIEASPAPLPEEQGVYYTAFSLRHDNPRDPAKRLVHVLLKLGAPYVCWPHSTFTDKHQLIGEGISKLLKTGTPDDFPQKLLQKRLKNGGFAEHITALWDGKDFRFPLNSLEAPK